VSPLRQLATPSRVDKVSTRSIAKPTNCASACTMRVRFHRVFAQSMNRDTAARRDDMKRATIATGLCLGLLAIAISVIPTGSATGCRTGETENAWKTTCELVVARILCFEPDPDRTDEPVCEVNV
jgi:hypothetical protein